MTTDRITTAEEVAALRARIAAVEAVIAPWSSRASRKIRAALLTPAPERDRTYVPAPAPTPDAEECGCETNAIGDIRCHQCGVVLWRRPCSCWAIAGQLYCWQHAEGKTR